jgi:putative holliday junction resolvase
MGRILAFDIGQKRIGLAVTDPMQLIATPLDTQHVKDIWSYLQIYLGSEEVVMALVGLPVQNNGLPSESMRYVDQFVSRFKKLFPLVEVVMWDERFTSLMAQAAIRSSGVNRKTRQDKALVDKVSATLLLQSYMLSQSSTHL